MLWIPTALDRLIQQAVHQVLSPRFDLDGALSRRFTRPGNTWPKAAAGWLTWTWKSSSIV